MYSLLSSVFTSHLRSRTRDDKDDHYPRTRCAPLLPLLALLLVLPLVGLLLHLLQSTPSPTTYLYSPPSNLPLSSNLSCSLFPLIPLLTEIPSDSPINTTAQLGLPSSFILWEESAVTCPSHPYPSLIGPSFPHLCSLSLPSVPIPFRWSRFPGPYGKPGFNHLCSTRLHQGSAFLSLSSAFAGPRYGYIYNLSHAVLMNPWYTWRYPPGAAPRQINSSMSFKCYDEAIMAHSMYDTTVGPHTILEVAPMIAWLIDHTPSHIPIIARINPALLSMYAALSIDTSRLVSFGEGVVYHANRMWWFRRPEEFTDQYWLSIRRRLFPVPLAPITEGKPLIILVQRLKKRRSIDNHDDLLAALLVTFPPSHYDLVVFNGSLSLSSAISLFSRATAVIAPHGGALLNALFMPPLSVVVEIAYPDYSMMPFPPYYYLQTCGLRLFHWIVVADDGGYKGVMVVNVSSVVEGAKQGLKQRQEEIERAEMDGKMLFIERMTIKEVNNPNPWSN